MAIIVKMIPTLNIGRPVNPQTATSISQSRKALKKKTAGLPKTKFHEREKLLIKYRYSKNHVRTIAASERNKRETQIYLPVDQTNAGKGFTIGETIPKERGQII